MIFSKIVAIDIDCVPLAFTPPAFLYYLANFICWIDFYKHLFLFVNSNQLLLIYDNVWRIHNLTSILQYNLKVVMILVFLCLCILSYQNEWVGHKSMFHWSRRYNFLLYLFINNIFELWFVLHEGLYSNNLKQKLC